MDNQKDFSILFVFESFKNWFNYIFSNARKITILTSSFLVILLLYNYYSFLFGVFMNILTTEFKSDFIDNLLTIFHLSLSFASLLFALWVNFFY